MIEKSVTTEDKDVSTSITALEFFLSLPDDLILNILEHDPEGKPRSYYQQPGISNCARAR